MHWVAGSGSGKSLSLGLVAFFDFLRGVPQVLFDPTGQMIDAFLLYVAQLPKPLRSSLWSRIRYLDMSGRGTCAPVWPLLVEYPGDSRQDVADRFLETIRAIDPHLESASIQGYNALYRIGSHTGVILSSLGLQLDHAQDLLNNPRAWLSRIDEAVSRYPEAAPSAAFFRDEYAPLSRSKQLELTHAYRGKLDQLLTDPRMVAMLCSPRASVNFDQVVAGRQAVLLDFRGETNPRKRLFKTRWVYDSLLAFIRHRGPGPHRPLAIHIDEITELTNQTSLEHDLFAADLDYLFNVLQRNYSLWITAAHQQMWQLSARTQETLMSLGTQLIGVVSDMDTAEALARRYAPLDPHRVKRLENVWGTESLPLMGIEGGHSGSLSRNIVLERRPVDFPMHEQVFLAGRTFMTLRPFEFLLKPRTSFELKHVSVEDFIGNPWPSEHQRELAYIRYQLGLRVGPQDLPDPTSAHSFDTMDTTKSHEQQDDD